MIIIFKKSIQVEIINHKPTLHYEQHKINFTSLVINKIILRVKTLILILPSLRIPDNATTIEEPLSYRNTFRGVSRPSDIARPLFNCRYLNPYIKLRLIELAIKLYSCPMDPMDSIGTTFNPLVQYE